GVDATPTVMASLADGATFNYLNVDHTIVFPSRDSATYFVDPDNLDRLDDVLTPWQDNDGPLSRLSPLSGGYLEFHGRPVGPDLPAGWRSVNVETEDLGVLVGFHSPRQIRPGLPFEVDVLWRIGVPPTRPDLESVFAHLVDDDGQFYVGDDYAPLPTTTWITGDAVLSRFSLTPPPDLPPGRYLIEFGRYLRPGVQPVRLGHPSNSNDPSSIRLGPVSLPTPTRAPPDLRETTATFGDQITLAGWNLEQVGRFLQVGLLWTAQAPPTEDYTVFVHLVAPNGRIVAQNDAQPLGGQFPTSTWQTGDRAFDVHRLSLDGIPPGDYHLEVGLYLLSTGQRLSIGAGDSSSLVPVHFPGGPTGC